MSKWMARMVVPPGERKDGQAFVIKPAPRQGSPLDVPGVDLGLKAGEIIQFIAEGRRYRND